ncbi:hypothetical protein ElyMa_001373900 [Elysia marginata]|uniref:G-protein coupled receptors family 2 profile 2 domain-containing protein n=1 Tax=Elysia marginata TaxID=1093978 RepID=A0AAV4ISA4_9GAST|nr:hypothetical protein ElyMa_001373900 [Elysia marginata]
MIQDLWCEISSEEKYRLRGKKTVSIGNKTVACSRIYEGSDSLQRFGPNSAGLRRQLYKASHISAPTTPRKNPQTSDYSQRSTWHLINVNRIPDMMSNALPPPLAFSTSQQQRQHAAACHRLDMSHRNGLFTSNNIPAHPDEDFERSKVNFSGRLPGWLWAVLTALLGIDGGKRRGRFLVATMLHILTVTSALLFACSGLFFNVYDILSSITATTVLAGICKSLLGAYWVGIGIYAHSLAARLFSNVRFVDSIRMHSKTIFKINTALIIVVLSMAAVASNIYWTKGLLAQYEDKIVPNATKIKDGNCVTAGVSVVLCEVYFVARIVYSSFTLLWNLLVSAILLSVCRTHTICIRRFRKELLYDTKIYEEFLMLQAMGPRVALVEESVDPSDKPRKISTIMESNMWDDDLSEEDGDETGCDARPPSNAHILHSMRSMRQNTFDLGSVNASFSRSRMFSSSQQMEYADRQMSQSPMSQHDNFPPELHRDHDDDELISGGFPQPGSLPFHFGTPSSPQSGATTTVTMTPSHQSRRRYSSQASTGGHSIHSERPTEEDITQSCQYNSALPADEAFYKKALEEGKPPILSNEDLYFTHFQLVRRLCSTSRLLQRWMLTLISFTLMWCGLLIIYWTSHHAVSWLGLFEFIVPLLILYLLSSAYAEVNFEGGRILKCVLPTHERMPVLYYMNSAPLELKVKISDL